MPETTRRARSLRDYVLASLAVSLLLMVVAFLTMQNLTDRRRQEAVRMLKKPEAVKRYEQLSTRAKPKQVEGNGLETRPEGLKEWGAKDKLGHWERLLAHWDRLNAKKSKDGWPELSLALMCAGWHQNDPWCPKSPRDLSPEEWARVEACLAREQDFVREILEVAALGGPVRALDLSWGANLDLQHLSPMRGMCDFLMWDVAVKVHAGDLQAAVKSLAGGMRLGDALPEEPVVISQFVRMALYRDMVGWALREAFEAGQLPPEDLRGIVNELGKADGRQAFADAIRGEAFLKVREFDALRKGKREPYTLSSLDGERYYAFNGFGSSRMIRFTSTSPLFAPWFNADEADLVSTMERIATAAEHPYYRMQSELASIDEKLASTTGPHTTLLLKDYRNALEGQAEFEASMDLTRMGLLLEEHRALQGTFPQTLDELDPDLGGTVPLDPFSGKPYHYAFDNDSFLLYSVGRNLIDDGGTADGRDGDIVWRGDW